MLGAELRKAREAAGLSQEKLGFKAGVHRTYVSMLERERCSPTVDTLLTICKVLRVRASDLIRRLEDGRK
jgi:transcriptional regulator with XRE-family HTH domain